MNATLSDIRAKLEQIHADLPLLIQRSQVTPVQVVTVNGLSDIDKRLGLVQAGEFRAGNGIEPGLGFSGVRFGYPAFTYAGSTYNVVGVNNDVLQFGLRSIDGKALAGGGVVVLDAGGLYINITDTDSTLRAYQFVDQNENTVVWMTAGNSAGVYTRGYWNISALDNAGADSEAYITSTSDGTAGGDAFIKLSAAASGMGTPPAITLKQTAGNVNSLEIDNVSPNIDTGQTYNINGSPHTHANPSATSISITDSEGFFDASNVEDALAEVVNGWGPFAFPLSFSPDAAFTTALALAANGGSIAIPIPIVGRLRLYSVSVRNTDVATQRTWGWDLYKQTGHLDNVLDRVATGSANETFTPGAASTRTIVASALVNLDEGMYWLVIQSRHATSTFGLGSTAASAAFALNTAQTKTTTNPNDSTIDMTAATWTKVTAMYAVRLNGVAFGAGAGSAPF